MLTYKSIAVLYAHVAWIEEGNSLGMIIPKEKVGELGLSEKDLIYIDIMKKEKVSIFGLAKEKNGIQGGQWRSAFSQSLNS